MSTIKTAVSLQKSLFQQLERLARKMKVSRSRLFALALEAFVQRQSNLDLLQKINAAYSDAPSPVEEKLQRKMRRRHRSLVDGEW